MKTDLDLKRTEREAWMKLHRIVTQTTQDKFGGKVWIASVVGMCPFVTGSTESEVIDLICGKHGIEPFNDSPQRELL